MNSKAVMEKNTVFSQLADSEKTAVAAIAKVRVYPRNTFIFWQNEKIANGFLVEKGLIKLYRSHPNGRTRTIALKAENDIVSEMSLVFPYNHLATAQVLARSTIFCFSVADLHRITGINVKFQERLRLVVNRQIESALAQIENRIFMNINGCLATKLVELATRFGVKRENGMMINLKLSQQQLADMIGTNRETICKSLYLFKKHRAIAIKNKLITILDKDRLMSWQ